jgi:hypothetical protein
MFRENANTDDCIDSELEPRTERALSEAMTLLPNHGRASGAPDLFVIVGENENGEYLVDTRTESCECNDAKYRDPDGGCKHVRRARIATGETPVPASALGSVDIDSTFGAHTDASAKFVTADGGIIDGDTGEEIGEESSESESVWSPPRPEIDPFGNYTGFDIVECTDCEVETIVPLKNTASHKEHCKHADQ